MSEVKTSAQPGAAAASSKDSGPYGLGALLSRDPPIMVLSSAPTGPLAIVDQLGSKIAQRPMAFLITTSWHLYDQNDARNRAVMASDYMTRHPHHSIIFLGNTDREVDLYRSVGADAIKAGRNIFVSEQTFRPLPNTEIEFDAVYNARPVRWKRHELARTIERVVYLCYASHDSLFDEAREILPELQALGPQHAIINKIVDGVPRWTNSLMVNETLNRAAVGLCFSAVEGQMAASMEYLLAGLPIVSTPSLGGRDVFFDADYCIITEPDANAIKAAVQELRRREIPRDYVRSRTLAKMAVHRDRFVAFLEQLRARHGIPRSYDTQWTYPRWTWQSVEAHLADIEA